MKRLNSKELRKSRLASKLRFKEFQEIHKINGI